MSTTTTNYGLIKPSTSEIIDIADINTNSDTIDAALTAQNLLQITNSDPLDATTAASVGQLAFKDNGTFKGLDEVRLYNGTDALYCKEGVTTGLLMQNNQIKVVPVSWNNGVPAVGTMKGYIDANGDYHIYDATTSADKTSLDTLRDSVSHFNFSETQDNRYVFQASSADSSKAVAISVQPSDNNVYMDYMTNNTWNGVIPLNSTVAGVVSKASYADGQHVTFNFRFKGGYATANTRVPVLIIAGHQSGVPRVITATLKGNGAGVGSTYVTVSNGTFTVDAGASSWAVTTVIYDPRWMTITA